MMKDLLGVLVHLLGVSMFLLAKLGVREVSQNTLVYEEAP